MSWAHVTWQHLACPCSHLPHSGCPPLPQPHLASLPRAATPLSPPHMHACTLAWLPAPQLSLVFLPPISVWPSTHTPLPVASSCLTTTQHISLGAHAHCLTLWPAASVLLPGYSCPTAALAPLHMLTTLAPLDFDHGLLPLPSPTFWLLILMYCYISSNFVAVNSVEVPVRTGLLPDWSEPLIGLGPDWWGLVLWSPVWFWPFWEVLWTSCSPGSSKISKKTRPNWTFKL